MNQLLSEIAGWFGFLQRLPVVLQLVELVHLTMEFLVEKEVQVEEE